MLYLTVDLTIKPEHIELFLVKVAQNAAASRTEPGCRQFDVLIDPQDRSRVMLFEIYDDEVAFDAHQNSAHFKEYMAEAVPLLAARERRFWRRLSSST